ncbi:preprotein translocase subunit SecF [Vibrio harveyi]|uniref:protein translocase subunit SecF n=1 Tax=Vibrio harveyi TaxID=669 RepID=UPI00053956A6|nr:protein translocase subunit SecF [Vibrio harveyi]AIV05692.1 preprotein translocase subunit SecF [Vibrio harveyi]HDM8154030.1 protein translocase subunit SecF [Vibrio harveyi]HDM8157064.1 protein translocase subunit SecF [Vibrio harveyi]
MTNSINVTKIRQLMTMISLILLTLSITSIAVRGFNWGLDFTGGVVADIQTKPDVTQVLLKSHLDSALSQDVQVTAAGNEGNWQLRFNDTDLDLREALNRALLPIDSNFLVTNSSVIGPQVGLEMVEQGGLAILACFVLTLLYLSYRFEWRLALGSISALVYDIVIVLGLFAVTQIEFNLTVLAALLAVMGYSLNDSIIISDRIREVFRAKPDGEADALLDQSIVSTLSRTLVTSGTTLVTVSALWLLGGSALEGFAIALCVGILSGTWSSISIGTLLPTCVGLEPIHYQPEETESLQSMP